MPKVNVNSATREELVEVAGLRPDIAEAILKLRGKHGKITSVDALEEVQGVGPATIEQLRKSLAFGEKGGNGSDKEPEKGAKEAVEKTAELASSAARGGAEAAQGTMEAGARAASTAARSGLQLVERTAGAAVEMQRKTLRRSTDGTAELGKLYVDLLNEQTRHNLQVAMALGRVVDWEEVIRIQSEFMRASFERMNQLNRRYLEIVQAVMKATASTAEDQGRKAA